MPAVTKAEAKAALVAALKGSESAVDSWVLANTLAGEEGDEQGDAKTIYQTLTGVIKSMLVKNQVTVTESKKHFTLLTAAGVIVAEKGAPELQVYFAIPVGDAGINQVDLQKSLPKAVFGSGFGVCNKNKWIKVTKVDKKTKMVTRLNTEVSAENDPLKAQLAGIATGTVVAEAEFKVLKKRKFVEQRDLLVYHVSKGTEFGIEKTFATDLTADMLKSGAYKTAEFKAYNFSDRSARLTTGCLHPLMKVRTEFRKILLEMGFSEMPTNNFVESSFWNFDSLFQPQQHPARDAHDTFFLTQPRETVRLPDAKYVETVKRTHEKGGFGSVGYRYDWALSEAKKNILRTHTTAVSSRVLAALGEEYKKTGVFKAVRRFSIDRVFRNESLDKTHLAEFHQVEGFAADYNLNLGDLIGTIKAFFEKMGVTDLRFKPAYNPYTEPSMEIFGYSKELKSWIEVGNSGMFRPEMLEPMGLPSDVRVIAWGLSLERPTMIKYGIDNIRDLFGPEVMLRMIQDNPICFFKNE